MLVSHLFPSRLPPSSPQPVKVFISSPRFFEKKEKKCYLCTEMEELSEDEK